MTDLRTTEFDLRTDFNITDSGTATVDDVTELHDVSDDGLTGDGITVVVMDSGIDQSHPLFGSDQVVKTVDVAGGGPGDSVGHGTACAGLITQMAPDVDLISLRIFGDSGKTSGRIIMEAYRWLIDHNDEYDIVNMSWGAQQKVQRIDDAHNTLAQKGVYTVAAAGNGGGKGGSPSTAEECFSAGAVDVDGDLTRFSSYNPDYDNPDVCAVGKNNRLARADGTDMGTVIDSNWTKASGTSFAAPIVTGLTSRLLEQDGDVPDLAKRFEAHARDIDGTPRDGAGIADYHATVSGDDPVDGSEPEIVDGSSWNFAGNDIVYIGADWIPGGDVTITKVDDGDGSTTLRIDHK